MEVEARFEEMKQIIGFWFIIFGVIMKKAKNKRNMTRFSFLEDQIIIR